MEPLPTRIAPNWISPVEQLRNQGFITPKEAMKFFQSEPGHHAIRKWMKVGVHNRKVKDGKGERIKLRCIREGSVWFTRPEWIQEFKLACANNVKTNSKATE